MVESLMKSKFIGSKTLVQLLLVSLLILAVNLGGQFSVVGSAYAAVINRINVLGNTRMDSDTVASYLSIKPGRKFGNSDIDESVKRLFATGLFRDVSIYRRGSTLMVEVDENPTINEVFFKGNKRLKEPALRSAIQSSSRSIYSEEQVLGDVETISNAYSRVGREDASVTYEVVQLANNRVNVVFIVNEGDKTKISTIQFVGNHAFGDIRLKGIMKTRESNFLSFIRTDDIYDPAKIQADEELLRRYYYNHGYADFQIISTVADLDPVNNSYSITISVDEGSLYAFGELIIESTIPGISGDDLYSSLVIRSGQSYSARDVEESIRNITNAVSASGYAFVEVVPRGNRNYETGAIDVIFLVDEGPRVYVERIDIHGNDRTRDYVIRREFDISEGDAYNQVNVQSTKRRLDALGFFERVDISTRPGSTPDRVIVIVRVLDKATGEFSIGGGYSTADGPIGNIKFEEKNFLGRGQYFAITGGFGEDDQEYKLAFTEPYFLGYRISAGFNLSHTVADATTTRTYSQSGTAATVKFGAPIVDKLKGFVSYRYATHDISIASTLLDTVGTQGDRVGEISAAIAPWQGNWVSSSVGFSLVYNGLDNQKAPRKGVYARANVNYAGVGGDADYVKIEGSLSGYYPISNDYDIVAFGRVRAGHINGTGDTFRVLDNFYQGGRAIRGFNTYGFGPRDPITGDALGGQTYYNATAEIQFPFPLIPESAGIRGAVFADAGSLFGLDAASQALASANGGDLSRLTDDSLRASVGVSLIWNSPFGPIRFDYAEPLSSQPWDRTRQFTFGASTSF